MSAFKIFLFLMLALALALPFLTHYVSLSHTFLIALAAFSLLVFKRALKLLRFLLKAGLWLVLLGFLGWIFFKILGVA